MIGWLFALLAVSARAADPGSLFEAGFEGFEVDPDRQRESAVYTLLYAGDTPVDDVHLTALVDDAAGDLIASVAVYEEDARTDWVSPGRLGR